ncbi:DCL family protein [Aeromonas veronii]|uniref:DCL family protein n=1 Tax=Aeromonas veronii TaxID=654 RepID=UPI003309AE2E|nr:DCL family protein [Aeromonas veronii]
MAQPIVIGDIQFKTKTAAKAEIRRRIGQYEAGDILSVADQVFFEELFKLHDEYVEKVGVGIKHIQVERDFHRNRCLYIHRTDGSEIDISWVHCVQPASTKTVVSAAFRRSVKERVMAFKSSQLSEVCRCPILDIPLDYENSHVAYTNNSFESLLDDFLGQAGVTFESIELINPSPDDSDQRGILKNPVIKEQWNQFYDSNARLTLMSAEANLRRKS